jgi:adhesin/invasin
VSGARQTTQVGRAAAAAFTVEVRAADELPIAGIEVAFGATTPGGSVGTASATTDASGRASSTIAAGKTAGAYAFSATAAGLAPLVTSLTATPALPAAIAVVSGGGQSAVAGTALPSSLVVKVSDEFGNGVSGTAVTWSVASGGGLLSRTSTTTDSTGVTSNGYLLGTAAGPNTITATSGSLSTTFSATALAGNAAKLTLLQGLPSSFPVGSAPASAIRVQVADAAGNAVKQAGTSITGSGVVAPGGTSAFTVSATTDADGVASFMVPTYVGPTGTATVTITSPGIASLVLAPVSIVTGPAARLVIGTQPGATTTIGVALAPQPIVQLADVGANAVRMAGVSVVATLGSGGGTLAGTTTVSTDANGAAAFSGLVIGGVPGARTLRFSASVGGATIATTSDTVSVNAPAVATLVKDTGVGADGQYVIPGASFGQRPRALDARGNGIPGIAVTFTASSGTVSASAITDAAGRTATIGGLAISVTSCLP